jgi:cytochrome P450 family 138
VRVCVWESHQDPQVFERPSEFNPDRWLDVTPSHDRYSPFGATGDRRCVGEAVTFAVARMLVEGLACSYDVTLVHDEGIEFSGVHWRPSTKFRIALSPRQPTAVDTTAIAESVGGLTPVGL